MVYCVSMKRKPWPFPPIIILALISLIGIGCIFFYYYPAQELLQAINNNDFLISATETNSATQVVGVMIDNHPDALPESGVSKAKIVYEAPVEGGLTRYLAIFDSKQAVAEVGPVRSARAYFLDWLQEYGNGLYMHSGGSPEALSLIKSRKIFDANEFFWGEYYWRSQDRSAPHNLYTDSDNWGKIISKYGSTSTLFTTDQAWKYARLLGQTIANTSSLKINFNPNYAVTWTYDVQNLNYMRSVNSSKETDKDGSEVRARNILVQITSIKNIDGDDEGRQEITTIGNGDAIILKKGGVIYGTWKKISLTGRTRFYDQDGKEVMLAPGNTWVEVVPKDASIFVTN